MSAVLTAGACLLAVGSAQAQRSGASDADAPALSVGAAATDPAPPDRATGLRARLEQIPEERHALQQQWLAAMVEFELSRAARIQAQIQALDGEKAGLERELRLSSPGDVAAP